MTGIQTGQEQELYDGGYLPLSAEKIEAKLVELWEQASTDETLVGPAVKLCLTNMVLFTDGLNLQDAELLAHALAQQQPSRVLLVVVDDDLKTYGAFVSTSCALNHSTGFYACWEIVQMFSSVDRVQDLPGAIRSLLVESIPLVIIDFVDDPRALAPLRKLFRLANISFGATSYSEAETPDNYLPFDWYRTVPFRRVFSESFGKILGGKRPIFEISIEFPQLVAGNTLNELVFGWVKSRLTRWGRTNDSEPMTFRKNETTITLSRSNKANAADEVIINTDSGATNHVSLESDARSKKSTAVESSRAGITMCDYILTYYQDSTELYEYRSALAALKS